MGGEDTHEHHQSALLLMYRRMIFSIAVGMPGTFQGTVQAYSDWYGLLKARELTISLPTPPSFRQVLEYCLRLVLLNGLGHHVQNIVHDSRSQFQVVVGFNALLGDSFGDTFAISTFKLSGK
jgi:hypothetical protein